MPLYQLLTDRTLAQSSAITPTTLIHIVYTGDPSQNIAGSSYKAELQQLSSIFSGGTDTLVTGGTYSAGTITFTNSSGGTFPVTGLTEPFTGGSGNCIADLYVSNIHSCSPLNINPLDEGNVYFGSTSGVTIDVTNSRLGINNSNPQYRLDILDTDNRLYYDPSSTGGTLSLSGNTKLPRYNIIVSPYLTKPLAGGSIGVRAWDDVLYPGYGKVGDMHIYAYNSTNGLNIINQGPGTDTEDYIRFYAGRDALFDPDIHIQGSGSTRGYVGIGTLTPSEKLDVSGKTKTTNLQVTSGATNGYVLTSDASGNASWQASTGGGGTFTGGTVSGATNFTNGLSANTISATTYLNISVPTLNQVLIQGNQTLGEDIILNDMDSIINTGNTIGIQFKTGATMYQYATDNIDKTTEISLDKEYITLNSTNNDDGWEVELQLDGQNGQMFETVTNSVGTSLSITTRQAGSIGDYCGNSTNTDYSSVNQKNDQISSLIVSGSSEVTKWKLNNNQISGSTTNGVNTTLISLTPNNFRVETDNNQNIFFVDGTNNRVGISTNTPTEKLTVSGNTNITGTLNIGTIGAGTPLINLGLDSSGNVVTGTTGGGTFTGGTVNGATNFTNGLSANTISATTYLNLPLPAFFNFGTASTINWNISGSSNNYTATLTAATTLNVSNVRNGEYGTIILTQDSVGSRTITLGTINGTSGSGRHKVSSGGGGSIYLTSNPNAIDIVSFVYDGNILYWTVGNDYT